MNNQKKSALVLIIMVVIIGTIYFMVNKKSSTYENTNTPTIETVNTSNDEITLTLSPTQASFINDSLLVTSNDGKKYTVNYQNAELKEEVTIDGKIKTSSGDLNKWVTDRKIIWAPNFNGPGAIPGVFTIKGTLSTDGNIINASIITQQIQ